MTTRILLAAAVAALAAVGGLACGESAGPCACTDEFRIFTVTVLDDAQQVTPNVTITRINLRTRQIIQPTSRGSLAAGTYLVADDGLIDAFSNEGDTVRVFGEKGGASFVADFVFSVSEPCRCHVVKESGPDTVIIGEQPPP